ncbi:DUF3592 domain-containing protein [Shewanella submarina]|uniref:DUF3592 domain-containing protein n=1 Tax=Shewanella submarina TaxID=2016376 RepID=A0ABV7G835_9GAMM|nr:DUF3592 domain-containing protein [Shewanella submarina]MCL1038546.1 DUF3592 domain-containing protein [Shewanella submarina]
MKVTGMLNIFIVIGILLMALGIYLFTKTQEFIDRAVPVQGVVIELVDTGEGSMAPVVEYRDEAGQQHIFKSNTSSKPPSHEEGETVLVLYDPSAEDAPSTAKIRSTLHLWGLSYFFLGFGALWLLIGGGARIAVGRQSSR